VRTTAIVTLLAVSLLAPPALADTIRVDNAGGGDYLTIQEALDAANDGDHILIATGTYMGPQNRDLTFGINVNVVIEPEDGQYMAMIDCEGLGRAFDISHTGQDSTTVIRGLVIQNGYTSAYNGGAIIIYDTDPIIEDCIFQSCSASHNAGAIYIFDTGQGTAIRPRVRNCIFRDCYAPWRGGALQVDHAGAAIRGCLFVGNSTSLSGEDYLGGGAIHLNWVDERYLRTDVSSCTFVGNSTGGRGEAIMGWNSVVNTFLTNCIVAFHEGPNLAVDSTPLIDGLTFFVMYGNVGGDIDPGYSTIVVGDPLFCDMQSGVYTLCSNSPALPGGNIYGQLIGFADQGCGWCDSAVRESSWGAIKAMYR
jgi:hypothetical protein